jgi:branched-chain amino acid transport system substrate-binding protein
VVLPENSRYPLLDAHLLNGMRLFLAHAAEGGSPAIKLVPTTYAGSGSSAQRVVQTLIEANNVDLIVGTFDAGIAAGLRPLLEQQRMPLLAAEVGANLLRPGDHSPYLAYNTLNYWQTSWALGQWAAGQIGRRAVIAAACYESGYDALYTFELGFTSAGGSILGTHITHAPGRQDDLPQLLATMAKAQPDVVYAMYSGSAAVEFVAAYAASPLAGRVPLVGAGFLVEGDVLTQHGPAAIGLHTGLPWSSSIGTPANRDFVAAYQQATGHPADSFAALGYDTARLIVEAARAASRPADLLEAMQAVTFTGPRGPVGFEAATRAVHAPIYLRAVQREGVALSQVTVATLNAVSTDQDELQAFRSAPQSGWLHPYLIA